MSARLLIPVLGWVAASALFAASGLMRQLPGVAIPIMIWGLALSVLFFVRRRPDLLEALGRADLTYAFLLHVVRAPVGLAFLALGNRGLLDPTFVTVAGNGDIIAGGGALVVAGLWRWRPQPRWVWGVTLGWNIFALADILLVFATAQRVLFFGGGMDAMQGFFLFPMPMIPTFLVPMILLTHLWIFVRLRRS